mmetsp:Transcript_16269/g.34042  ORF Transcript_16269/g.34042 Transcript_16269/m.34042 type:complete len:145 (-) Transcript_16269:146-580(-)
MIKKTVTFSSDSPQVNLIKSLSSEELASLWISREERQIYQANFRSEILDVKRLLREKGPDSMTSDDIIRCVGIERFLSDTFCRRVINQRREYNEAVLNEIRRQAVLGVHDEVSIRRVSERLSEWYCERAHSIATRYCNMEEIET